MIKKKKKQSTLLLFAAIYTSKNDVRQHAPTKEVNAADRLEGERRKVNTDQGTLDPDIYTIIPPRSSWLYHAQK